ncbi:MAG: protein kinase [Betaproteobacteria bacterium]|nr:protein kinase [Betaproteobacteria bacterium]
MSALHPGVRLQEYVIRSVIGEGGFGIVYLAHDTLLDREVAIKEYLPATLATRIQGLQVGCRVAAKRELFKKGLRHFVDEAHILARFHHPGLVAVLRFIEANGTAYMVMPYYRGTTLQDMVRSGYRAKTAKDLLSIMLPVLEGLSQIHSVKCYHLDVSSDNILILEDGTPVLLDFGSARHVQEDKTAPSTIFLKPGFASIEQYSETDSMKVGPWTDIYAISALAYLVVTGKMPIISVARVLKDQLVPLSTFASPELPAQLLKVIEAGLSVEPSQRPKNVESFIDSLEKAAVKGAPKLSLPKSDAVKEPSRPWVRPFLESVAKGMAAMCARLPKLRDVLPPFRAALARIGGWGVAIRKAMLAALGKVLGWAAAVRKAIFAVLGKVLGWGTAARKAIFAALAVMWGGLLRMLARLASMPVRLAKSIGKTLPKAGARVKAGIGWLLNVAVSAASKAGNAIASAASAFWNFSGKLCKKAFAGTGRKPYWVAIGASSLLVLLGLVLFFPKEKVSAWTRRAEPTPPVAGTTERLPSPQPELFSPPPLPQAKPSPTSLLPEPEPSLSAKELLPTDIQVTVSVKPWGDIYLDGVKIGTAPPTLNIKVSDIKVGPHKVEIRNESGKTHVREIVVKRDQPNNIAHTFK